MKRLQGTGRGFGVEAPRSRSSSPEAPRASDVAGSSRAQHRPRPETLDFYVPPTPASTKPQAIERPFRLFFTTDTHGRYEQLSRLVAQMDAMTPKGVASARIHGGDAFAGGPAYSYWKGLLGVGLMNDAGFSMMALGNHEMNAGVAAYERAAHVAHFPILSANFDPAAAPLEHESSVKTGYVLRSLGPQQSAVKVAFFVLSTPQTHHPDDPTRPIVDQDLAGAAQRVVDRIRAETDAELVVCVAHCSKAEIGAWLPGVEGIDLVVNGHDHKADAAPVMLEDKAGARVPVVSSGAHAEHLLVIDGVVGAQGVDRERLHARLVDVPKEGPGAPKLDRRVKRMMRPIEARNAQVVLRGAPQLLADQRVRLEENLVTSLLADALLWTARQERGSNEPSVDIALVNAGLVRGGLPDGQWTRGALHAALPYDNGYGVVELSGALLRAGLEAGLAQMPTIGRSAGALSPDAAKLQRQIDRADDAERARSRVDLKQSAGGGLLTGAGLRYAFDLEAPPGGRLREVLVERDGAFDPLDDEGTYRVALPEFILKGGWNMPWAATTSDPDRVRASATTARAMVEEYVDDDPDRVEGLCTDETPRLDGGDAHRRWLEAVDVLFPSDAAHVRRGRSQS